MKATETAILTLRVTYDPNRTSAEDIESTLNNLLDTATSTDGILDEIANPDIGPLTVAATDRVLHKYADAGTAQSEFTLGYAAPIPASEGEVQEVEHFAVISHIAYPEK